MQQFVVYGLVTGAYTALLASAFHLLFRGSAFFVFTLSSSYLCAAYGMLASRAILPLWLAAITGVAIAAAIAVALEDSVYRPIRDRGRGNLSLMLASIGVTIVIENIVTILFGEATRSVRVWDVTEGVAILGTRLSIVQVMAVMVAAGTIVATAGLLRLTRSGRALRAVASDTDLAIVVGLPVRTTRAWAAAVGGGSAGVAGILMSLDLDMRPTMGFQALLLAIVGSVVGGITSYGGAVIGGLTVGVILQVGVWRLPTAWQSGILFVFLTAMLLLRPQGILGRPLRKATV